MRRNLILVMLCTLAAFGVVVTSQAAAPACTKTGSPDRDILAGGPGRDIICAKGGNDYLHGNGGADLLKGGKGRDVIIGGSGQDEAHGAKGKDRIFLVDGRGGGLASGGAGHDQCFVDRGDRTKGCEEVFVGVTQAYAQAITSSFHGGLVLAEELIGTPPVPPPTVTVTATVTITENCDGHPAPPPIC